MGVSGLTDLVARFQSPRFRGMYKRNARNCPSKDKRNKATNRIAMDVRKLSAKSDKKCLGNHHPSPNVRTLCNFESQIWPKITTSHDGKSTVSSGKTTSIIFFRPKSGNNYLSNSQNHFRSVNWMSVILYNGGKKERGGI